MSQLENEGWDKHVESVWFPCADEGSTPSRSTMFPCRGLTLVRVLSVATLNESGMAERDSLQVHDDTERSGELGIAPRCALAYIKGLSLLLNHWMN